MGELRDRMSRDLKLRGVSPGTHKIYLSVARPDRGWPWRRSATPDWRPWLLAVDRLSGRRGMALAVATLFDSRRSAENGNPSFLLRPMTMKIGDGKCISVQFYIRIDI